MKLSPKLNMALLASTLSIAANADSGDSQITGLKPDSHAPIGVMGDHTHNAGEWMLSVRSMTMRMEGHRIGENEAEPHEVFARGFSTAAVEMDMDMQMLGLMYAPSERVTLMAMANYARRDMIMMSNPHAIESGHGHTGMFAHSTEGWGDISLTSLVRIRKSESGILHLNLGISAPTGSVDEKMGDLFQPYGMQLGSGTWDAKIGATYVAHGGEIFSWGSQILGTIRLESAGDSGFARADAVEATAWSSWRVARPLSLSTRIAYRAEGPLRGHYNDLHGHAAPPHFTSNFGGDIVEAIVGANYVFLDGILHGNRIALEFALPVYQQLNGVGMNREESISLGWQSAW